MKYRCYLSPRGMSRTVEAPSATLAREEYKKMLLALLQNGEVAPEVIVYPESYVPSSTPRQRHVMNFDRERFSGDFS